MNRRQKHIQDVIEWDTASYNDIGFPAETSCTRPDVMEEILKLPVAAWNDPGTVAGEIDTERKHE